MNGDFEISQCALLQTGTKEEIQESAEYSLEYGNPGGRYIFSSSNCVLEGIPPENYEFILEFWREKDTMMQEDK